MEAAAASTSRAKRRRSAAPVIAKSQPQSTAAMNTPISRPEATPITTSAGIDRISGLPDAILGDIISLLPTKDGARTQALASRWRHIWRAAPLNLDLCRAAPASARGEDDAGVVSRVVSAHHGPGRVFCVSSRHVLDRPATVDAWLRSPALDGLREIEFHRYFPRYRCDSDRPPAAPPSAFRRFSATLRAATFTQCHIPYHDGGGGGGGPGAGHKIWLPQLQKLALEWVLISEGALHGMISGSSCPALEHLFLNSSFGFRRVRINSNTLRRVAVRTDYYGPELQFRELVIEDAPCLEKLLIAEHIRRFHLSVISAPKLETLGALSNWGFELSTHVFGSTVFQGLCPVGFTSVVRSVKILSVDLVGGSLDMVIDLMKCFSCLEKFYIKGSISQRGGENKNLWRRKHKRLIQCFDIPLKTLVLEAYEGIRSHVEFASFFLMNARELELMRLGVVQKNYNDEFFAKQRMKLQVERRASRGARLDFALNRCHCRIIHIDHVHDLAMTNPFECTC